MKQTERREQSIQTLLNATKRLIKEKGCDSTTLTDIMKYSGLSKGAIFHYVKTKDEIYTLVLLDRLEEINARFQKQVNKAKKELEGPLHEITQNMMTLNEPNEITNQILVYLLSKTGRPEIDFALKEFYNHSVSMSRQWIEIGKKHNVIPDTIDTMKAGELFVLLSLGFRMRAYIPSEEKDFQEDDFIDLIRGTLQPEN